MLEVDTEYSLTHAQNACITMAESLEDKVRRLLDLLDEVERGFQEEPDSIEPDLALHLLERLDSVASVVDQQYSEDTEANSRRDDGVGSSIQRQPNRVQQV